MIRNHGFVYFVQAGVGGPIKIGFSWDPVERMGQLQASNPHPLSLLAEIPGSYELEREYHVRFKDGHILREWFLPETPGLAEEIDRIVEISLEAEIIGGWCKECGALPLAPSREKFCSAECARACAKRRSRDLRRRQRKERKLRAMESIGFPTELAENPHG